MALVDVLDSLGSQESVEQVGSFVEAGAVPLLIEVINTRGISIEGCMFLTFLLMLTFFSFLKIRRWMKNQSLNLNIKDALLWRFLRVFLSWENTLIQMVSISESRNKREELEGKKKKKRKRDILVIIFYRRGRRRKWT